MPVPQLMETTVADVHAAFRAGTLTCCQLVQFYLDRVAAYEDAGPRLNAITHVNPRALVIAAELDAEWRTSGSLGSLHGIPVLLKDNVDTADMPTTSGSRLLKDWIPPNDATITASLRAAGAVILGKASMGELAAGNYNTIDGQQINPYHFGRTTGGSSSGSASAVAANLTLLAVGTDTYTSVRGPAAFNGIVGLRPTTGVISRAGVAPRESLIDTAGPMARSVADVAKLLTVLAGPDPRDPLSVEIFANCPAQDKCNGRYNDYTRLLHAGALQGARVGLVQDFFGGDPEIDALAHDAVKSLSALGCDIVPVRFDTDFYEKYVLHGLENLVMVLEYGFRQEWEAYLATLAPEIPKTAAEWVHIYRTEGPTWPFPPAPGGVNAIEVLQASLDHSKEDPRFRHVVQEILPELTRRKLELFQRHAVDALVFSYQPNFAPPISNPLGSVNDPSFVAAPGGGNPATLGGYGSLGFPMIVVPMGFGTAGLPMGLAFMGRPYDDARIIGFAYDYEQATRMRRPPLLLPDLVSHSTTDSG